MLLLCLILNLRDLYSEICASVKLSQSKPLAFEEGGIGDLLWFTKISELPHEILAIYAIFSEDILKWNISSTQKYPLPKLFLIEWINLIFLGTISTLQKIIHCAWPLCGRNPQFGKWSVRKTQQNRKSQFWETEFSNWPKLAHISKKCPFPLGL